MSTMDLKENIPASGNEETNHTKKRKSIIRSRLPRLYTELEELTDNGPWGISVNSCTDDMTLWTVTICGPVDSPYEGEFEGILKFSSEFPFLPPTFEFITEIFHPNIDEKGVICLGDLYKIWSPCCTVWSFLGSIQCMLSNPNADEPLNKSAAFYYQNHTAAYEEMVVQRIKINRKMIEATEFGY